MYGLLRNGTIAVFLIVLLVGGGGVQRLTAQVTPDPQPSGAGGAVIGGLLGGFLGFIGGAFLGGSAACSGSRCQDFEALGGAIVGAAVGEALLLPIGVHLGNGSAGSVELDFLMSLGTAAATLGVAATANSGTVLVAGVISQLALTVWTERRSGARQTNSPRVFIQPGNRGVRLGFTLPH